MKQMKPIIVILFSKAMQQKKLLRKTLGIFLDSKLDFDEHIKEVFDKNRKSIGHAETTSSTNL